MSASWILIEVTVILALALAGTHLARRSRASVRHVLLASAFGGLLILPVASMVAPAVQVEVPAAVHAVIAPLDIDPIPAEPIQQTSAEAAVPVQTPAPRPRSWPSLSTLLVGAWIGGALLFLAPVAVGLWQVRALRRSGLPWRDGGVTTVALAVKLGLRRGIDVLRHESVPGPMTWGLVRPAIVLPMDAASWAREDLHRAVVHELEHVRRADWLTHCLARIVAACYWFHPIVWVAWRQLVLEAERACDDAVLRESEATAYADQLVTLAERLSAASSQPQLAMANRRDLATRVRAVLDGAQRRGKAGAIWVGMAIAVCTLLVVTMSPLRIVAGAARPEGSQGAAQAEKFDVVSIKPCAGDAPPTAAPPVRAGGRGGVAPWHAQTSPGSVRWDCVTLPTLIDQAYADRDHPLLNITGDSRPPRTDGLGPVRPKRVRGGPAWVETDKFTIEAKASLDLTNPALAGAANRNLAALPAPMSRALRAVLEDRFQLKVHRATEQQDMFALTVAKGGLNKERMKATTTGDCLTSDEYFATDPAARANLRICGRYFVTMGSWEFSGGTMKELAAALSSSMEQFVLDQTGVDSKFTYVLDFADRSQRGDDLFISAVEKLGLRIARTKGPAEYLVIDSVQKLRPDIFADGADTDSVGGGTSPQVQKFDVASIKPCAPGSGPAPGMRGRAGAASPGYLQLPCYTLRQLLNIASGNTDNRLNALFRNRREGGFDAVRGGPAWVASDQFTVEARAAGVTARKTLMGAPLLALLEDRFQLTFHRAVEERPVYALTVAAGGLKLQPLAPGACYELDPANMPAPMSLGGRTLCGIMASIAPFRAVGAKLGKAPLAMGTALDDFLSSIMDRVVVDKTGLDGRYDIAFDYAVNEATPGAVERLQRGREGAPPQPLPTEGPSIFAALEKLGLKLTPAKEPVEYLVIDRVERLRPDSPTYAADAASVGKPAAAERPKPNNPAERNE